MRKRTKVLLVVGCLVAIIALTIFLGRDDEPRYQGRPLLEWYHLWAQSVDKEDPQSQLQADEALKAVQHIGTNALPFLLQCVRYQHSPWRDFLCAAVGQLPGMHGDSPPISWLQRPAMRANDASAVFVMLGPQASPAVPELAVLMQAKNQYTRHLASFCLLAIGDDALLPLLQALGRPEQPACYEVAYWLTAHQHLHFTTNLAQAVPLLVQCSTNTNAPLAEAAIKALGRIALQPQITIPALTNCLSATDRSIRCAAIRSLARFGPQAVPLLQASLNDPDRGVRGTATNSLLIIHSQALTNTPVQ